MIPDLDVYRAANVLVKQHGKDAPIEAAMPTLDQPYRSGMTGLTVIYRHSRHVLRNRVSSFSSRHLVSRLELRA